MSTISGNDSGRQSTVWVEWIAFCLNVMGMAVAIAVVLGCAAIFLANLAEAAEPSRSAAMSGKIEVSAMINTAAPR